MVNVECVVLNNAFSVIKNCTYMIHTFATLKQPMVPVEMKVLFICNPKCEILYTVLLFVCRG